MIDTLWDDPNLLSLHYISSLSEHAEVFKFTPDLSGIGGDDALARIYAVRVIVGDDGRWTITRGPRGRGGLWDAKAKDWASAALAETGAYDFPTVAEALAALPDALDAQERAAAAFMSHQTKMRPLP